MSGAGLAIQALVRLGRGKVMHARSRPVSHTFSYPVFYLRLRIDQPQALAAHGSWLLGINRRRPVAFFDRDHGARDGSDLNAWLAQRLAQAGVHIDTGEVWLQTFPRVFGYLFSPVSFWFVHDRQGVLRALLAEVNNTFGERHDYVLTAPGLAPIGVGTELVCRKRFFVSPFCEVRGAYRFRLFERAGVRRMAIDYFDATPDAPAGEAPDDQPLLRTAIWGHEQALRQPVLLRALLAMPLLTLGVIWRIHWQALRLWLRGVPLQRRPRPEGTDSSTEATR